MDSPDNAQRRFYALGYDGVIMVMLAGMRKFRRNTMNILKEKVAQDFFGNKTDTPGCNR